ncbi:MAG: 2,6-beta-D-fructofuranosidase, partial [Thermoguttaceae bacterium]|nr:2,6-beta-D-fructofuranosidase [Thermoguttaceae bacterium]
MKKHSLLAALVAAFLASPATAEDVLVADFNGPDYGDWVAEGEAFGPGPARGTLPDQMNVSNFEGEGLVNSYYGGDGSVGTLTSPEIELTKPYVNFLIGGGGHPGDRFELLVGGEVVRVARGPNVVPGGSEALDWATWDVSEFQGRKAVFRVVDAETG